MQPTRVTVASALSLFCSDAVDDGDWANVTEPDSTTAASAGHPYWIRMWILPRARSAQSPDWLCARRRPVRRSTLTLSEFHSMIVKNGWRYTHAFHRSSI